MGYTICILAQQGASSGDDPRDGARSGVPRLRREPHRREVRIPTAAAPVPLPGAGFVGPHPKTATVERRERFRSPRDRGSRVAGATEVKECACRRSIHPSIGGDAGGSEPDKEKYDLR